MVESSEFCTGDQHEYGIIADDAVAHRANVQDACRVRPGRSKLQSAVAAAACSFFRSRL
jgi:hypothetical protein